MVRTTILTLRQIIESLKNPGDGLAQRAISSGFWVFFLRVGQPLFTLCRLFILARILSPNDFGLMGIALLTMATLETFSQTGFQTALIQKKENIEHYLDSAWTFLILRGFALFIILYLIAPYAAAFFGAPEAEPIIQVIGVSVLLQAFTNIGVIYFQKELEFNKQFIYQFAGTLADFIVAVSAVLVLQNVWALIFGLVTGNAVRCIISYVVHPYRPHLALDIAKIKELFGFGKWIFWSSILIFLLTQGDDILVGGVLGATALGLYQMAYMISNMPATEITHVISQVTFPAYAKMQHNIPKLREAYLKTLQFTALLSFPIAGIIFVLAPDFTGLFLGEKWLPMVPAMQVLVFWGLIRSIGATTGPIFYATGQPKILTNYQLIQLLMVIILIYPFTECWGILGTSLAILMASIGANVLASYAVVKITGCEIYSFIRAISLPLAGSLIAVIFIVLLKICWSTSNAPLTSFILTLVSYGSVYFGVICLFNRVLGYRTQDLVKGVF